MEEKEKILKSSPTKEEHLVELLTQWEMELNMLEDCLDCTKPKGVFQEITMLGRTCQHALQLEEYRMELDKELMGVSLSEEIVEKKFSKESKELKSAVKWPVNIIVDKGSMGDQVGLLIDQ
jgi:hypothetical protein